MQWNHMPDLSGTDYMMQMGGGPQYFNGMQPGFNGFYPGFNGYAGLYPSAIPPFMGYGLSPMDMAYGGGMNMMYPDQFVPQGFGFPNIPQPHRDGENSRMMMNNETSTSVSNINTNQSRQEPPSQNPDDDRRRRLKRFSPEHHPSREINLSRDSNRRSERYPDERDRQSHRQRPHHRDLKRQHDHRDRRDDDRSRDHRQYRDSERNQHHHRNRSETSAATKSEIDDIKRRKVSSSTSVADPPTNAIGTSSHRRHSRKEIEVGENVTSDEDRHFKRKRSPSVSSYDEQRYSKHGKRERFRA